MIVVVLHSFITTSPKAIVIPKSDVSMASLTTAHVCGNVDIHSMNPVIEQKLKELWQESLEQNVLGVHIVTHLLLASYQNATHGDFAKWCCQYSSRIDFESSISGAEKVSQMDFDNHSDSADWIC